MNQLTVSPKNYADTQGVQDKILGNYKFQSPSNRSSTREVRQYYFDGAAVALVEPTVLRRRIAPIVNASSSSRRIVPPAQYSALIGTR